MKLYFKPGACSLSPHIALKESGLQFETVGLDLSRFKTLTAYLERVASRPGVKAALQAEGLS